MKRIAIDTNVIDVIAETPGLLEAVQEAGARGALRLIATHVQRDQLAAITDGDRRARLLAAYAALPLVRSRPAASSSVTRVLAWPGSGTRRSTRGTLGKGARRNTRRMRSSP